MGRCGGPPIIIYEAIPGGGALGTEPLAGDSIELHVGLLDALDNSRSLDVCRAALSREEKRRAERFAFGRHRRLYVFAHGLLRFALSDCLPQVEPSDWSFATDRYGRPFVAEPRSASHLYFSLSHTDGCVACAVSGHKAVGIDVERVHPRGALMDTAQSVFSPQELQSLGDLAPAAFVDRFFDYWTLKEAYLKANGRGLSLPLSRFSVLIGEDDTRISFAPDIDDDPRRWRFTTTSPSPNHRLAIADGTGMPGGLPIIQRPLPQPLNAARSDGPCEH